MSDIKRPVCHNCLRPQRTCICDCIVSIDHATELLILQHPLEVGHAKGSGRLLHLCTPNSRLLIGEAFDEASLRQHLFASWSDDAASTVQPVLLYPDDATSTVYRPAHSDAQGRIRLIVLDGTWRKSRKMLHLNPLLQQLPRLQLLNPPPSHYSIRKAHAPDQLSTLEATCHALIQLESGPDKFAPLLAAFDRFVARQRSYVPLASQEIDSTGCK